MKQLLTTTLIGLALLGAQAAQAQPSSPAETAPALAASAEVAAAIAKAKASQKPGQTTVVEPLLRLSLYATNLEYRTGAGVSAIHERDAELFFVLDGSGVLQTGGVLVSPRRTDPANIIGTALSGAATRRVAKGDVFIIPQGAPHWFSAVDDRLVMISMHLPGPAATPAKP